MILEVLDLKKWLLAPKVDFLNLTKSLSKELHFFVYFVTKKGLFGRWIWDRVEWGELDVGPSSGEIHCEQELI